jgi:hypothetical protein
MMALAGPEATLADGSVALALVPTEGDATGTFIYGWRAGDAVWRQIAPPLAASAVVTLVAPWPGTSGGQTLWAVGQTSDGLGVARCLLAATHSGALVSVSA